MIIWLSTSAVHVLEALLDGKLTTYLGSFYEGETKRYLKGLKVVHPSELTFFLDSGAYGAWSKGTAIDIDEYIAFIKANAEHIEVYANLDVIPGEPGRNASKPEREAAAEQGWKNFLYMRAEGLSPVPVFHVGEDWKWLDLMMQHCDYIGLGGMVGSHLTPALRRNWLDETFSRICDEQGKPRVKVHGFGMTAIPLLFRYPWYSVDSTTWIQSAANGNVYLPAVRDGEFVFDQIPMTVPVSEKNPGQTTQGKAANTFSPAMRDILDQWLAECGKTYQQVCEHYYHRAVVNVCFFKRVSEAKLAQVFKRDRFRKQTLVA